VERSPSGWEIGVHSVTVRPEFAARFPGLLNAGQALTMQFLHADHVVCDGEDNKLPPKWIPLGSSRLCQVQGLLLPGRVLTYQGHPEFDSVINDRTVSMLGEEGVFPRERLEKYLALVRRDDDRALWGEVAVEFFLS
jgi:GMP synthase-like glutamine amidotransferase